jgi:hypothetical protein
VPREAAPFGVERRSPRWIPTAGAAPRRSTPKGAPPQLPATKNQLSCCQFVVAGCLLAPSLSGCALGRVDAGSNAGFTGADCSLRVCPFSQAFIDLPQGDLNHDNALNSGGGSRLVTNALGVTDSTALNPDWKPTGWWERHPSQLYGVADQVATIVKSVRSDEGHFYAECGGVGICDRSTGQCNCFPGYGGAACNRTVCPNDCSGHGVCRTLDETLPAGIEWYRLWETTKMTRCVCDGGYSGIDCSQRLCPRGDDPLTTKTTRTGYNQGLLETAEVQYLDVRCRYGGSAINPKVRIVYTDSLTGDSYQTSIIDLSTATGATILAALKALPNEVLSDYIVDGVTVSSRIDSLTFTELETSKFWRIAVTFNEALGDVPNLSANVVSGFLCPGALAVNTDLGTDQTYENVAPDVLGDGPDKVFNYEVEITVNPANAADTFRYRVYGQDMAVLTDEAWVSTSAPTDSTTSVALTNAANFDRQAALVKFYFEAGKGDNTDDPNDIRQQDVATTLIYRLTYDPRPIVEVSNPVAALTTNDDYWRQTVAVYEASNGTRASVLGDPVWYDRKPPSYTPRYDMKISIRNMFSESIYHSRRRAELLINDEHIGFINGTFPAEHSGTSLVSAIHSNSIYKYRVPTEFSSAVPAVSFPNNTNPPHITIVGNSSYITFTPKTPTVVKYTGVDSIDVSYRDNEAVNMSLTLVLKIVATTSSPDTYGWKFAGDSSWNDNNGAGYGIPAAGSFNELNGWREYLAAREDEARRWMAGRILLRWNDGSDFDSRLPCTTNSQYYYIQFGYNGLNDRPVCSDRGLCDGSSGNCNCYSGYTGSDCSEQNALARGSRGGARA